MVDLKHANFPYAVNFMLLSEQQQQKDVWHCLFLFGIPNWS